MSHASRPPVDPDPLIVAVGPGGRSGEYIQLRVSPDALGEVQQLLKDEGVFGGYVLQESAEVHELVALLASFAGGLHGVAAVLRAIFNRHQHRALLIKRDGDTCELRGLSQQDMDDLIDRTLTQASHDQQAREQLYRGIPGLDDDPE